MRTLLAHDYLTQYGGAERVALLLADLFPEAETYTSIYMQQQTYPGFAEKRVRTSWLQRIPLFRRDPRLLLPLLPTAWRVVSAKPDLVVASSTGFSHGVTTSGHPKKIVYCHNPPRWLYQADEYAESWLQKLVLRVFRHYLVTWDSRAAQSADAYVANSKIVADRIKQAYGIDARVIHPPVMIDVDAVRRQPTGVKPGYWLTVSRGRGYKNVECVTEAFARLGHERLVVVGQQGRSPLTSRGTVFLPQVSDSELRWLYANAKGLISVAKEDFGLTPLEANAFGTPVLLLQAGGFLETLEVGVSGYFIEKADSASVYKAVAEFEPIAPDLIRGHARQFSRQAFEEKILSLVDEVMNGGKE